MAAPAHALLLDQSPEFAAQIRDMLAARNIECSVATDGKDCWAALASIRPDTVLLTLSSPGIEHFYRHLRDEYMGPRPRLFGFAEADGLHPSAAEFNLDGVLLRPVRSEVLLGALAASPPRNVALELGRVREMLRLTSLGAEFQESLDSMASRLTLVYGVDDCLILANSSERQWVGSARGQVPQTEWTTLWDRCDRAVNAGAPLFFARVESEQETLGVDTWLGAPILTPGGAVVGAVCLVSRGTRLFTSDSRDALGDLALRVGAEFAWRSIHDHVSSERDRLRETAMLDPLLGIHTRAALEQALTTEVGRYRRSGEPLSVAVLDVAGLRVINDRYGHLAGDAALKHMADSARRIVRAQDVVGRYGGDEIAVLMPSTPAEGAKIMLRRLCDAVESEPFEAPDGTPVNMNIAIGITEYGGDIDNAGALLVRAAACGYAAKRRGDSIGIADPTASGTFQTQAEEGIGVESGLTLGGMYEVAHEISRGAMGVVYRAEDLGLSRPVAIKMLRPDLVNDKQLVSNFRQEAGILASLNHANLVRVYAFVEDKDDVFFVMELVEGLSLDDVIAEYLEDESFLPAQRVSGIVSQIASALDAMHDANVMHRDVKPGNIVLDRARDRAVLVDVGLAQRFGTRGEPAGTPGFIAPESFRGGPETPATDVYGLAATTYALLVGRAPFGRSDDYREILRRQLDQRPPLPSSYRRDITEAVDLVIHRGLAVSHSSRYSTAGEFARELANSLRPADDHDQAVPGHIESEDTPPLGAGSSVDPPSVSGMGRHTLPLDVELLPPAVARAATAPMTRGIIFRGAARVLGMLNITTWSRNIARTNRPLADALSLRTNQMAWLPADLFHDMLDAVAASGRNTERFTRELGSAVVQQSFRRFYPSSAESLSPAQTLSALDILWRRYHTWGHLDLKKLHDGYCTITYEGPGSPAMCSFITGWLHGVVKMSGGRTPRCNHTSCTHADGKRCEFSVGWSTGDNATDPS